MDQFEISFVNYGSAIVYGYNLGVRVVKDLYFGECESEEVPVKKCYLISNVALVNDFS